MPDDTNGDARHQGSQADPAAEEISEAGALDTPLPDEPPTEILDHGAVHVSPVTVGVDGVTQVIEWPTPAPTGGRRFGLIGAVGAVAIGLVAVGGVYAYSLLSGGGAQPEDYVPANAIAYLKLDLDPSAGQKIEALRFFRHFPDADAFLSDEEDIRKIFFELAQEGDDAFAALDFDEDIAPWLGDRIGIAALPGDSGGEPVPLVLLQVRDEERAREGLRELFDAADDQMPGIVFAGGYALLAEDGQAAAAARDDAAEASLADDETFSADMAEFDDGVAASWVDLDRVADLLAGLDPAALGLPLDVLESRMGAVVSFDDNYIDLTFKMFGGEPDAALAEAGPSGELLRTVPSDTLIAFSASGIGPALLDGWSEMVSAISAEPGGVELTGALTDLESYGITLPDDLAALLGEQTLLVVAGNTLVSAPPLVGLQSETDTATATEVMFAVEKALAEAGISISWETDESTLYVGLAPSDLSAMQSGTGIADPAAATALPRLDTAQMALWVDLDALGEIIAEESGGDDVADVLAHIAGIGLTADIDEDGTGTVTLRVVAD